METVLDATPVKIVVEPEQFALYPDIETVGRAFTSTWAGQEVCNVVVPL